MRKLDRAKMQKGFTLIEIIAALAIIGLGLVGILSLFPVGIDASKRAGDLTNATVLAHGVLDQIRAAANQGDLTLSEVEALFKPAPQDFDADLAPSEIVPIEDSYIPKVKAAGRTRTLYQYQVRFDDPSEKLSDLKKVGQHILQKVTVTVSWPSTEPEIEFRNRVTLVTFIRFPE
jgi:prepilin-type N-terminal cleavage/methylation domain-containing protein